MRRMLIRNALPTEKRELEALQLRASLTNAGDHEALLKNPDAIDLPLEQIVSGTVFVLELAGGIAGFAAVEPRSDGNLELDGLFVEPDARRQGAGRLLVEYCVQTAADRGSRELLVLGNPHAHDFYLACGFNVIGQVEMRFGPALRMRRATRADSSLRSE